MCGVVQYQKKNIVFSVSEKNNWSRRGKHKNFHHWGPDPPTPPPYSWD